MTHFLSSRDGLFIFNEENAHVVKILEGKFFGIVQRGPRVYLFGFENEEGSIWSFYLVKGRMFNFKKELTGLDYGCHQMAIFEDHLYIPDTYEQRLVKVRIDSDGDLVPESLEYLYLWPKARKQSRCTDPSENEEYLHVNAMTFQDGRCFFMCPSIATFGMDRKSKIQVWDPRTWTMIDEYELDRWWCHDLVIVGHEIYFCDGLNFICKLNLVTRKVTEVLRGPEKGLGDRNICRGLSIGPDMKPMASTTNHPGNAMIFTETKEYELDIYCSVCMITRVDGKDFNNQDSDLRRSYVQTFPCGSLNFFSKMVEPSVDLFNTVLKYKDFEFSEEGLNYKHDELFIQKIAPKSLEEFLNPVFETFTDHEPYINKNEKIVCFGNPDLIEKMIIPDEFQDSPKYEISGNFYFYREGHGMGWHTNRHQVEVVPSMSFRCYFVKTTGGTFFFYRHPVSKKVHAIHDIDASVNVFRLVPDPYFWHSIGSITGDRFSIGYRTGLQGLVDLGIDPKFYI
jgi:hypothetical protein